ncbi:hypothetical protein BDB01DRAFT_771683 [Pilobolus umbonatus]|nr:hypothetical protein BDB01DRAFT_771683 [Pilobolus umbonatus]
MSTLFENSLGNPHKQEDRNILGTSFYSPMALLYHWETNHSNHKHQFKSVIEQTASGDIMEDVHQDISYVDKENESPIFDSQPAITQKLTTETTVATSRTICQVCHTWLKINYSPIQDTSGNKCLGVNYLCHHFHTNQLESYYQCCGCDFTLTMELEEPVLPMLFLKQLEADRPMIRSMADIMQNKKEQPTVASTLSVLSTYIRDLLKGIRRNINTSNTKFMALVGMSEISQQLLEFIGFTLKDAMFIPPLLEADSVLEQRLKQINDELLVSLDQIKQDHGGAPIPINDGPLIKPANLNMIVGVNPTLESMYISYDDYINKAYAILGLTSGASDVLVNWTYQKLIDEHANTIDPYTAMDALTTIANHTNSNLLLTRVAYERSRGVIGRNDIGDAYAYFGVTEDVDDDKLLIGLYNVKCCDEPHEKNTHRDKLKIIAIARESITLLDFLKEGYMPNAKSIPDRIGVPAHLSGITQGIPVGLNNIGNTCYFNSLLQYYYTLLPFRHAMIHNEQFVEGEDSEPKKIGGINVDQSEIRRAKKFVELMKDLFINLQQTTEKAISPEYELAYMALLDEREEDRKHTEDTHTVKASSDIIHESLNSENIPVQKDIVGVKDPKLNTAHDTELDPLPSYEDIQHKTPDFIPEKKKECSVPVKERPSVDAMMFGKQQDVTECMGNVMYLVEAALKPLSKTTDGEQVDDLIRQLFYGKARQILSYCDNTTLKVMKKEMEEDFSHVIIDGCKNKDLYDGLDEYFFADKVENFQGGHEATREVTVKSFPPILQILVQRVQFNRATSNIYKSNEFIQFDKTIYMDRYADKNFDRLKHKRTEVANWRAECEQYQKEVEKYTKEYQMPIPDLLEATSEILMEYQRDFPPQEQAQISTALQLIKKEGDDKRKLIDGNIQKIKEIKHEIRTQYDDYKEKGYNLHAVFIHQGQASYGHYWIYIYDHIGEQWWKYNDSFVTKVNENEVFQDTTGSTANPYFLVYVDANRVNEYVETIATKEAESI